MKPGCVDGQSSRCGQLWHACNISCKQPSLGADHRRQACATGTQGHCVILEGTTKFYTTLRLAGTRGDLFPQQEHVDSAWLDETLLTDNDLWCAHLPRDGRSLALLSTNKNACLMFCHRDCPRSIVVIMAVDRQDVSQSISIGWTAEGPRGRARARSQATQGLI